MPGRQSIHINESPYAWYGDPALKWTICENDCEAVAFTISRLVDINYHLHSLYVDHRFQKSGLGKRLLMKHWEQGFQANRLIDTFSLHVDKVNTQARAFYEKHGYREINQENVDLEAHGGLGVWARNCKSHGDWPLRKDHLLYMIWAVDVKAHFF